MHTSTHVADSMPGANVLACSSVISLQGAGMLG